MTTKAQAKRPAPLSLRLNQAERKRLEKLSGDQPFGRFIKDRIFTEAPVSRASEIADRYQMLARVLAALGENDVFANLDAIAKAIGAGDLVLTEEQQDQIATACLLVLEMRNDLIRALGLKPPAQPHDGDR
ncbi:hypothetical protein [Stappia sp. ES.058]|uniref:hypothetical protein n=1 Tax=Stappia sp. ES.058 TaxID=1881061 RepID=UPI000879FF8A|nr:hypothetical protein [Stappia sp. ES.058]SDT95332.1 hypothetical protein SAMN05428979_0685 [Stappia sp. ES.058]